MPFISFNQRYLYLFSVYLYIARVHCINHRIRTAYVCIIYTFSYLLNQFYYLPVLKFNTNIQQINYVCGCVFLCLCMCVCVFIIYLYKKNRTRMLLFVCYNNNQVVKSFVGWFLRRAGGVRAAEL